MLHALKEYADDRCLTVEPGFKSKNVRWLLAFDRDGNFQGILEGREFPLCPHLSQPEIKAGGSGCRHFLVDNLEVVTLYTSQPEDSKEYQKLKAKHDYFISRLTDASQVENDLKSIAKRISSPDFLKNVRSKLSEMKAKSTDLSTFAVVNTKQPIIVERTTWHDWWREFRQGLIENTHTSQMLCLLSGKMVEPIKTHPKITGLSDVGGISMGDNLASFKQPSFRSFGLEWAENSAMSEEMAETYRVALDSLIKENSRRLAGAKVVYWYIGDVREDEDPLPDLFEGWDFGEAEVEDEGEQKDSKRETYQAESRAARLLNAVRIGDRDVASRLRYARYCALTLSGNSGRVVVRDWMEGHFDELIENIDAWFLDLSIIKPDGNGIAKLPGIANVITSMLPNRRQGQKYEDWIKPIGGERIALWNSALRKYPIPYSAMAKTLEQVKKDVIQDEPARHARFGLLKAYLNRKKGGPKMTEKLNTSLNEPAYLCGRIMALLADIQRSALPNVGAGVVQRYYAAASATPGLVLGRLVRLAQTGHLPKIEKEKDRDWFEKQMVIIWDKLNERPPATLDLEGQTLFAMGYYQQKAYRPPK